MKNNNPTNGELAIMLENLNESLKQLHGKADYTNGKVTSLIEFKSKTEDNISKIPELERDIERAKGTIGFLKWIGFTGLIGIITALVNTMK